MGSAGMKRKGRRYLRKVPSNVGGPLGDDKYHLTGISPGGSVERNTWFIRGLRADSKDSRRRFRIFDRGIWVVILAPFAVAVVAVLLESLFS